MKKCTKCGETKELSEFYKDKNTPLGVRCTCKSCCKEYSKNNIEYKKEYYKKNKDKIKHRATEYYKNNRNKKIKYSNKYYNKNKVEILEKQKKYRYINKDKINLKIKEWRDKNPEYIKEYRENYKEMLKHKRKTEPLFKLKDNLRTRSNHAFNYKSWKKGGSTEQLLGIDYKRCKLHIERQFTKGMTWENRSEWHIDHIIPLASATNEIELRKLCHYTNLQPLWASDNLAKSATIPEVQIRLRI